MSIPTRAALLLILCAGTVAACGDHDATGRRPASPSEVEIDHVRVSKQDPAENCTFVTMVKGETDDNYEELREDAAEEGANYIVLDGMETSSLGFRVQSEMVGRAFRCPPRGHFGMVQAPPPAAR